MTRTEQPPNPLGVAAVTGTVLLILMGILAKSAPELFLPILAVYLMCGLAVVGAMWAQVRHENRLLKTERDAFMNLLDRMQADLLDAEGRAQDAEALNLYRSAERHLRSVPRQLGVEDAYWDRHDDEGGA